MAYLKKPWQINMMPVGDGSFYLYLHDKVRKASHTKVGDTVTITIKFDEAYQNGPQHPIPTWFADELRNNKAVQENWNALPPSRQKEILRYFANLKSNEAKQRNLEKAIHVLSGKPRTFLARIWKDGR